MENEITEPNVFDYMDARVYMQAWFDYKKSIKQPVSYRLLSKRAGFKAHDTVQRFISGKKNLTPPQVFAIFTELNIGESEGRFFEALVYFNQAENNGERSYHLNKMRTLNSSNSKAPDRFKLYDFFSQWHHLAIRSILPIMNLSTKQIGDLLDPPLPREMVEKSIELQVGMGLLKQTDEGWITPHQHLKPDTKVYNTAITSLYEELLNLANRAIKNKTAEQRKMEALTMTLSKSGAHMVWEYLDEAKKKILNVAANDAGEDLVWQVNMQAFTLSENLRQTQKNTKK